MSVSGLRVLRGPDWRGGDTDGGEGHVGTVTELLGNNTVRVLWDMGQESTCSAGHDGKCELRILDSAPAGVRHAGSRCGECRETDITGTLWRCQDCTGCDLCPRCYSDDKHDLRHQFLRIDTPEKEGQPVSKRKKSVKCRAIGIFPGSKVTRGKYWQWGDQDGGEGSEGEVKVYEDSSRNMVRVEWQHGVTHRYRLGFQGNVDVTCVEEEVGPSYYRDHLPLLDVTECPCTTSVREHSITYSMSTEDHAKMAPCNITASRHEQITPAEATETDELSVVEGDRVAIRVGDEKLKELQQTCGGCTDRMFKCVGLTGEVTGVSNRGVVSVRFPSSSKVSYRFHSQALLKIPRRFTAGDTVRIRADGDLVKLLNSRLGWNSAMDLTLNRVGRVEEVDSEGVTVTFGIGQHRYSPACCVHAPHAPLDTLVKADVTAASSAPGRPQSTGSNSEGNTLKLRPASLAGKDEQQNMKLFQRMREMVVHDVTKDDEGEGRTGTEALYHAIHVGNTRTVMRMCQRDFSMVERQRKGTTPLIYACLRGQRASVLTLLDLGADVNRAGSGNVINKTPLSAAIQGENHTRISAATDEEGWAHHPLKDKDATLTEVLLERGAHVHSDYGLGQTALHVAVLSDQPVAIRALAKHGADVNAVNDLLDTPLHVAVLKKKNRAVEALLAVPQVDMYAVNKKDFNTIHLACYADNPVALLLLLARDRTGVDVGIADDLSTAVHIAAINDHLDCLRLLVTEGGADIDSRDNTLSTALHSASHSAKLPMVEALLELGADVNVQDEDGDTPLHLAVGGKVKGYGTQGVTSELGVACRVEVSKMLISGGAWVDVEDKHGRHPLGYGHGLVRAGVKAFMEQNTSLVRLKRHGGLHSLAGSDKGSGQLTHDLKGVGLPCGVCGAPTSDVTLQPCQHKCVCSTCSVKVTLCPLCDEEVKDKVYTGPDEQPLDLDKARKLFLQH